MADITREQAINGSPEDKGAYIKSLQFTHRNLETVRKEVKRHMTPNAGFAITIVSGPGGVGKSEFSLHLTRALLDTYKIETQDRTVIPVVRSEIAAAGGKEMNWQLFYQTLLQDLDALAPAFLSNQPTDAKSARVAIKNNRMMLDLALRARKVRNLILDEVVQLTDTSTNPLEYGNLLKSLANRANMNLLLVGAYGSEKLMNVSGQLARRVRVVHFPRYRDNKRDFDAFVGFIRNFDNHIPLPFQVPLGKHVEKLFRVHLGHPGWTVNTLKEVVNACATDGARAWRDDYLENALPPREQYETIGMETLAGEEAIKPYLTTPHESYPTEKELKAKLIAKTKRKSNGKPGGAHGTH